MLNFYFFNYLRCGIRLLIAPVAALGLLATAGAARAQAPSFSPMTAYPSGGSRNYFVATGDLNGDGVLDIVSANSASANISVLLGQPAGGFNPAVQYAVAGRPEEIALADLNRDGKLDAVLATTANVAVLLGAGNGTLGTASLYPTATSTDGFSLKLYDVTRDGIPDAVVTNLGGSISVLPGTATGAFGPAAVYSAGSSLRGLSIGDFNQDGLADVVVSDAVLSNLYVLLGQGSGFAAPVSYPVGQPSYVIETADLNQDGRLDIITGGYTTTAVSVLSGNANGTFNPKIEYPASATSTFLSGLTTGDVNGDGYPDVIVEDAFQGKTLVLPGSSTGALGAANTFGAAAFAYDVTLADINRDGKPDLVVGNGGDSANTIGILLNTAVYAPRITSFSPVSGPVGTSVTLTGANLGGATGVSFTGTAASTFSVNAAGTQLTATVPAGATAGLITVTTPRGTATSATGFCVQYTPSATSASRCGPGSVTLGAGGAPAGGTYAYYSTATGGTALGNGAAYLTPNLNATTTYYVGVTTGSGATACEGPRTPVMATINPLPVASVTAGGLTTFCQGGSVVLTASPGAAYLWSTGATTQSITVAQAGSYGVTVSSAAGCSATSASTTVTVNPAPAQPTITQTGMGGSPTLTSSAGSGNQWYRNGVAIAGATGQAYTPTSSGIYTVVVTSAAGCASPASAGQALVLAATSAALAAQVQVFPNPTRGAVTLSLPGPAAQVVRVQVLNALGQEVPARVTLGSARIQLDLTGLATGVYAVRVQLGPDTLVQRVALE